MRFVAVVVVIVLAANGVLPVPSSPVSAIPERAAIPVPLSKPAHAQPSHQSVTAAEFATRLAAAAEKQTLIPTVYDSSYARIAYPGGDVPADRGVCADVVIRAYRALGIDLQVLVHRDMARAFSRYPQRWGLARTDTNIDHRRVPNLETFFRRRFAALPISKEARDYKAGDLVSWIVAGSLPHIGIVSSRRTAAGTRPLIVHNIGDGPRLEDVLFEFPLVGHFRYAPVTPPTDDL
jgi:uncharacterized protein YijF (DUF1287 family)